MKLFNSICLFVLLGISFCGFSQNTFQRSFGYNTDDQGYRVIQTNDGGYLMGCMVTGANDDYYLIKLNSSGDTLWTRRYGLLSNDFLSKVIQTNDGGYLFSGATEYSAATYKAAIFKLNANGDTTWTRNFQGTLCSTIASDVVQTSDGGYAFVGSTDCWGAGNKDFYFVKLNAAGDTVFTKIYGGTQVDSAIAIRQTPDGGYLLGGTSNGFGWGGEDFMVIRTNSVGDTLWTRTYGSLFPNERMTGLELTTDGGFVMSGIKYPGTPENNIIKADPNGNIVWQRRYTGVSGNKSGSIIQTSEGGYLLCAQDNLGFGSTDMMLMKTDSLGAIEWTRSYGGSNGEVGNSAIQTSDGGYVISGYTGTFSVSSNDPYLVKTDLSGNSGCNSMSISILDSAGYSMIDYASTLQIQSTPTVQAFTGFTVFSGGLSQNSLCFASQNLYSVSGIVYQTSMSNRVAGIKVYLFETNSTNTAMAIYDSTVTNAMGEYFFYDVQVTNQIIIGAIPDVTVYPNLVNTYYPNFTQWTGATPMALTGNFPGMNINMQSIPPHSGPGSISGAIYEGPNFAGRSATKVPIKKVPTNLIRVSDSQVVDAMQTDSLGKFVFDNLPLDNYFLWVDITGIPLDMNILNLHFNLSASNPTVTELEVLVDSNLIYFTFTGMSDSQNESAIQVFPNPNSGKFHFRWSSEKAEAIEIVLFDLTGQKIYETSSTATDGIFDNPVDISKVPSGIYFLRVKSEQGIVTRKVVKL